MNRKSDNVGQPSEPASEPLPNEETLTQLLHDWSAGHAEAEARLFGLLYPSLRRIAANALREERPSATLQTTDLVHESYLLLSQQREAWQNRAHFFAIAARVVRRVLVDHARRKKRDRRGAGAVHVPLDQVHLVADDAGLLAVDRALVELAEINSGAARLVELRYFGGLSIDEAANVIGCGRSTVVRSWRFARAWLHQRLADDYS
ncbi:MAG: ECF-type sigma factor [Myxococcota bacterium]